MKIFLKMITYDDGVVLESSNHLNETCLLNMNQNGYTYSYDNIDDFYLSLDINIREAIKKSLLLDVVFEKLKKFQISEFECMEGK